MSLANVTGIPLSGECNTGSIWEIIVFGLVDSQCKLQKDHKYWIAIAPEQQWTICGQTGIVLSANPVQGDASMQYATFQLSPLWSPITGNADVDARDLAVLLGNWGSPYGPVELANLLGVWGPC